MKGVYILACLVGLGFVTWVAVLVVNGIRARNARKLREKTLKEMHERTLKERGIL